MVFGRRVQVLTCISHRLETIQAPGSRSPHGTCFSVSCHELFSDTRLIVSQNNIWTAGSEQDYQSVTGISGEPLINTMDLEETVGVANSFLPVQENVSAHQLWQYQKEKTLIRQEYLQLWNDSVKDTQTGRPVDAIICPPSPYGGAPPHGKNRSV